MMAKVPRWLFYFLSALSFFISVWFLMWLVSSSSLASDFCQREFSLFHDEFRCRQPFLAIIGFLVSVLVGCVSIWFGFRASKRT